MTNGKQNKTHKVQSSMTEANFDQYEALLRFYFATTPGTRLSQLAVKDLHELKERAHTDKVKGLNSPE